METSLILGVLVGMVLGLTGAGGGILAVPALIAGMGWSMQQASPVALIAVACGAIAAALDAWKNRLIYIKEAIFISVAAIPFSALGVRLAHILPQHILKGIFALVLLFVGLRSLKNHLTAIWKNRTLSKIQQPESSGLKAEKAPSVTASSGIGVIAGLLSGMLGVGGGFVIVPMLQKFSTLPAQKIVATSLMVIALISISSVINAMLYGVTLPLKETAAFVLAVVTGVLIGRKLIVLCNEKMIQLIFSLLLVFVATGMIIALVRG